MTLKQCQQAMLVTNHMTLRSDPNGVTDHTAACRENTVSSQLATTELSPGVLNGEDLRKRVAVTGVHERIVIDASVC